jgi:hypothetical protein
MNMNTTTTGKLSSLFKLRRFYNDDKELDRCEFGVTKKQTHTHIHPTLLKA